MANHNPIEQFPDFIDRDYFGAWLSGLTDGEGHFRLGWQNVYGSICPRISFTIHLRADDFVCLELVRQFWKCGRIYKIARRKKKWNPLLSYDVFRISDLWGAVVPHFIKYPLVAKKSKDFETWKRGVELYHEVSIRKISAIGFGGGWRPRWTDEEREEFGYLVDLLIDRRKYKDPD